MALIGTRFHVSDNSGAKQVQCIRLVDKTTRVFIGSIILVSVKQVKHKGKVTKGDIRLAIIVELKSKQSRYDGNQFACSRNAVVLISETKQPIGTRILGTVPYELRQNDCLKLLSLATSTI